MQLNKVALSFKQSHRYTEPCQLVVFVIAEISILGFFHPAEMTEGSLSEKCNLIGCVVFNKTEHVNRYRYDNIHLILCVKTVAINIFLELHSKLCRTLIIMKTGCKSVTRERVTERVNTHAGLKTI